MGRAAAAAALLPLLALAGCSSAPVEGSIYKKNVIPAQVQYVRVGGVQVTTHTPECYEVEVDTPQQTTEALCIPQDDWLDLEVGQYFNEREH